MVVAFKLNFTVVSCARCGSKQRVVGYACPDCGDQGRTNEVNDMVTRRRQAIRLITAGPSVVANAPSEPLPYYLTRSTWRSEMGDRLEASLVAFADLAADPLNSASQDAVKVAIARMQDIEVELSGLSSRRPYVQDLAAKKKAAACLVRMTSEYLSAFTAVSPGEAQKFAERAQAEIDSATELLNAADRDWELGEQLGSGDPRDFAGTALKVLAEAHPEKNFMEIDAAMRSSLRLRLGREVASGQGAGYVIAEVLAKSMLDVHRFRLVVADASKLFISEARLRAIAGEPGSLALLLRARNAIVESTVAFATSMSTATTDEARLRRTVNLYRELFEDGGAPLFAWFLRITGAKSAPVSKLMLENSTLLLELINRKPELASLFVGADKNIRTGASHGLGYELVGQDVVFNLGSFTGTMTVEVLIDLLLALIESLLAAFWVLDNELAAIGVEGHTDANSLLGASMLSIAEAVLEHVGATVVTSECTNNRWRFVLAPGASQNPTIYAAALGANPPKDIEELTIVCPDLPEGELRFTRDSSKRFLEAKDSTPITLIGASLTFLSESMLDGGSALSLDQLRRTASLGGTALLQDTAEAVGLLRQCIQLAKQAQATEVIEFCGSVLAEWRSPNPGRLTKLRATMVRWSSLPSPMQPGVRVTTLVIR